MSAWSKILLKFRNEPTVAILSGTGSLLFLVAAALLVWQYFVRQEPLYDGGNIFPPSSNTLPVGTIVAFFGDDRSLPNGWAVCDGRDNPSDSKIRSDADSERGGVQLPDLRHQFIRGSHAPLQRGELTSGGTDTVDVAHLHHWAEFTGGEWYSYDRVGERRRVDNWNNGIDNEGRGNRPLSNDARALTMYTDVQGGEVDNRPAHVELRYIIKVR